MKSPVSYCLINPNSDSLQLNLINPNEGGLPHIEIVENRSTEKIIESSTNYWKTINEHLETGVLSSDTENDIEDFWGELISNGSNLAIDEILSPQACNSLWALARESVVLVLVTNLLEVPWEALYLGDFKSGSFLGNECVIVRKAMNHSDKNYGKLDEPSQNLLLTRTVFLTQHLEETQEVGGKKISAHFESGVTVISSKQDFFRKCEDCLMIEWICHHEENKGLQLKKDLFFTANDIKPFGFPSKSVVVLASCSTGITASNHLPLASQISDYCSCTVVSTCSVLPLQSAVLFIKYLNHMIDSSDNKVNLLYDLWDLLRKEFSENELRSQLGILRLLFCIYGAHDVRIKPGKENSNVNDFAN